MTLLLIDDDHETHVVPVCGVVVIDHDESESLSCQHIRHRQERHQEEVVVFFETKDASSQVRYYDYTDVLLVQARIVVPLDNEVMV